MKVYFKGVGEFDIDFGKSKNVFVSKEDSRDYPTETTVVVTLKHEVDKYFSAFVEVNTTCEKMRKENFEQANSHYNEFSDYIKKAMGLNSFNEWYASDDSDAYRLNVFERNYFRVFYVSDDGLVADN